MALSAPIASRIASLITDTVRSKLQQYQPESSHMPFHHRLIERDRYAMFSFIQSLNTTFGMSLWEQIAVILAEGAGFEADRQVDLLGTLTDEAEDTVQDLHYQLRKGEITPDIKSAGERIRSVPRIAVGDSKEPDSRVDLTITIGSEKNYFDIITAKPNLQEFAVLKLKLLKWTALSLAQDKSAAVSARLGIPYNPYHPEPYERWTLKGLYDLRSGEILVGEDFWNFVAGTDVYDELLSVFEHVGKELRGEIDDKFASLRSLD